MLPGPFHLQGLGGRGGGGRGPPSLNLGFRAGLTPSVLQAFPAGSMNSFPGPPREVGTCWLPIKGLAARQLGVGEDCTCAASCCQNKEQLIT